MALVNYDVSDEELSEEESRESDVKQQQQNNLKQENSSQISLNKLPAPRTTQPSMLTNSLNDIVLSKKPGSGVKISVPSVREYEDDSDDDSDRNKKRFKPSASGTALSMLLPKPKNASSLGLSKPLVPHSVTRSKPNLPAPKRTVGKLKESSKELSNLDDGASEVVEDFFSLSESTKVEPVETYRLEDNEEKNAVFSNSANSSVEIAPQLPEFASYLPTPSSSADNFVCNLSSIKQLPSNDYTYKKLIASKFGEETPDEINIIDVDVSKHLKQSNEWLKTISEEKEETYTGVMPTSTARRKHQITYLALQAKQREVELKNQWAMSKMTKSQTRAKYGF